MAKAYVYILGNDGNMLYVGMTNDLHRRIYEHKNKAVKGYTRKYGIDRLLFFEEFNHAVDAIDAEKRIKGWLKSKKLDLIRTINPKFEDLSDGWFDFSEDDE